MAQKEANPRDRRTLEVITQGQPLIAALLALGVLLIFAAIALTAMQAAGEPPLLADPVPTSAPNPNDSSRVLPPQYRGAQDEFSDLLALLAVVSPLLTTLVGFYFGARSADAGRRTAEQRADAATSDAADSKIALNEVVARLEGSGAEVSSVLDQVRQRFPDQFESRRRS